MVRLVQIPTLDLQCTLKAMIYFETCEEIQLTVDVQMQITVIMLLSNVPYINCY